MICRLAACGAVGACLFSVPSSCTSGAEPPVGDCVVWLDFEEVEDGGFVDRASQNVCSVSGAPRLQQGAYVASPTLTAKVERLPGLRGTDELTACAWVAPAARPASYQTILYRGKRRGSSLQQIHFSLCLWEGRPELKFKDEKGRWHGVLRNGDRFLLGDGKAVQATDVPAVAARRWTHVAATFERGAIVLYLNGEPVLSGRSEVLRLTPNAHPLLVGSAESEAGHRAYVFDGLLDDVGLFDRALTADDVRTVVAAGKRAKPDGEVSVPAYVPPGYDPEFTTTLRLVEAYKHRPPEPSAPPVMSATVESLTGVPTLHCNGSPLSAMAMMPEPYVPDDEITLSCRDFAAAGVRIVSEIFWTWSAGGNGCSGWWLGEGEYDFARIDRRFRAILAADPNAMILPRLKLNPPQWWLSSHPDEISREEDGTSGKQASLASLVWEEAYERMLRDVVRHIESSEYAGRIIGYHPAGGGSSEWFWWGKSGRVDYSPAARRRFRGWLEERYQGEVQALRRAWGDNGLAFDTAEPPSVAFRRAAEQGVLRDPAKAQSVIDFRRFLSDMVSRNIVRSCRIVKEETGGKKLAGVFYGYSLYCVTQNGYQGLERVLASPHVDFLCSPTSYSRRRGGDPGGFVSAYTGSYRLHGKLYWDEVDTRTHLYPKYVSYRTEALDETLAVLQRACGYSLTKGTALWWFLLAGNATFHQEEIMADVARMSAACKRALGTDRSPVAEVAVFGDEESTLHVSGNHAFYAALLRDTLDELACMGAPFDVYHLSDAASPALPEYKVYVFLNAFRVSDEIRGALGRLLRRDGKTAVWVYAPGYIGERGFSEDGIHELTGIRLRAVDEEAEGVIVPCAAQHPLTAGVSGGMESGPAIRPVFYVDDPGALVLGNTASRPSLAVKDHGEWRSVYSLLPLRKELLLAICRYAGVHVYSASLDPFFANRSYAMIHTASAGKKRIELPQRCDVWDALSENQVGQNTSTIEAALPAGVTRIYRLQQR